MSPRNKPLGELEQLILLAVLRHGEDTSGGAVGQELYQRAGRDPVRGTLYVTLDRLENKGYVKSRLGEPTPERGGKAQRLYRVTPSGLRALKESGRALMNMWQGLESFLEES